MPSEATRDIPRYDSLTTLVRDEEGHGIALGDFAENVRNQPDRTRLHRHDYPELFYFYRGTGSHLNDFREYAVRSPSLVFVGAGHVHAWPDAARLRGDMLSFDAGFALRAGSLEKSAALFLPPAPVVMPLNRLEAATVRHLFLRIRDEWRERGNDWLRAVRACLSLLHVEAARAHARRRSGHETVPRISPAAGEERRRAHDAAQTGRRPWGEHGSPVGDAPGHHRQVCGPAHPRPSAPRSASSPCPFAPRCRGNRMASRL
jgi:mannose-6-phosphate isomerase-like protein (cupin superfamily)